MMFFYLGNLDRETNFAIAFMQILLPMLMMSGLLQVIFGALFPIILSIAIAYVVGNIFNSMFPSSIQGTHAPVAGGPNAGAMGSAGSPPRNTGDGGDAQATQQQSTFQQNIGAFATLAFLFLVWFALEPGDLMDTSEPHSISDAGFTYTISNDGEYRRVVHSRNWRQYPPHQVYREEYEDDAVHPEDESAAHHREFSLGQRRQREKYNGDDTWFDLVIFVAIMLGVYTVHMWPNIHRFIARTLPANHASAWRRFTNRFGISPRQPRPGSVPAALSRIPDVVLEERHMLMHGPVITCAICLENMRIGETAKKLVCNHYFHKDCVVPWLSGHNSCPTCRTELESEDSEPAQDQFEAPPHIQHASQ